ncbi:Uncharacterised protein [Chlamydia trachomatis]|nr:Uncharacterised protein [Chlamydia trachomatis]
MLFKEELTLFTKVSRPCKDKTTFEERNRFGQDNAPVSVSFSQRHRDHPLQVFCKIAILVTFSALWVTPMQ